MNDTAIFRVRELFTQNAIGATEFYAQQYNIFRESQRVLENVIIEMIWITTRRIRNDSGERA